ncbi:MAG: hypothetical protein AAGF12_40370 [Myxococcota bacterium]
MGNLAWLLLALAYGGCDSDDPLCGQGTELNSGGVGYCYYQAAITEEGFRCPELRPNRFEFTEFSVCSERDTPPPSEILEVIRRDLGLDGDGGTDATPDAPDDAASDAPDDAPSDSASDASADSATD